MRASSSRVQFGCERSSPDTVADVRALTIRSKLSLGSFRRNATVGVGIGGGLGALCRYELGLSLPVKTPPAFPSTTLLINLTGAFALGLLVTLILEYWPPTRYVRPFFAIGVLGGYTTFSTFMVESARLIQTHHTGTAITYMVISLVAGMIAVFAGAIVARAWPTVLRSTHRAGDG